MEKGRALVLAAEDGQTDTVRALLDAGVDVDAGRDCSSLDARPARESAIC
jgi:hypothetical protein